MSGAHPDSGLDRTQDTEMTGTPSDATPRRPLTRSQVTLQAPMMAKVDPASGATAMVYKSFSPFDLSVVMQKLPPMQAGGENWLRAVQRATTGQILTAGDVRALLTQTCPLSQLEPLLKTSGMLDIMDHAALTRDDYLSLFNTLNALFPIPELAISDLVFALKPDEEAAAFIDRALVDYSLKTGHQPTDSALYSQVFRAAVLKGVPRSVVQAMEANPDLPGADHARWLSHLKHHLRRHSKDKESKLAKHNDTESQLAVLQLQSLKKQEESLTAIPPASAIMTSPVMSECMLYQSGPFMGQSAPSGGWYRCHKCGHPGHWARDCHQRPQGWRGRGRGGEQQRGSYRRDDYQPRGRDFPQRQPQQHRYPPELNQQYLPPTRGQYPQ